MEKFVKGASTLPWIAAMLLSALVTACGGGSGGQEPILGSGGAQAAPMVTAATPAPGTVAVPVSTRVVTATFNKAMDPTSLSATSFTLGCSMGAPIAGGVVTYAATGSVASLTLPAGNSLPLNTLCTGTVTTGAKDTTGIAMAAPFVWTFTTIADTTPPTVTATVNANGAVNVAINTKIGATFSEVMAPATLNSANFTLKQGVTPLAGTVSSIGVNAVFAPTAVLAYNTVYTVTVKGGAGGAADLTGNVMTSDYVWSWTTGQVPDTTAPTVIGTINANGATGVAVNTKVGATFSEGMDPLSITAANFKLNEFVSGNSVAGAISYSGVNAVFAPQVNLSFNTRYTATVKGSPTGVKDLAGNLMASDYVWIWTTGAAPDTTAPTVILVNPLDLVTNVAWSSSVNATFSEAIDPLTMNSASFTLVQLPGLGNVPGLVTLTNGNIYATFNPTLDLLASTTYRATVTTATTDLAGNHLAINKVWDFTTAAIVPPPVVIPSILASAATFGTFGGSAGMTNTGISTVINGNIGTTATGTSSITGFYDSQMPLPDVYTGSVGKVNGTIYTCTTSTTGPTSASVSAPNCAIATQARADALAAYNILVAKPVVGASPAPGANMAGITLLPGVYTAPGGSFLIDGAGDLTLDAQGDANAVWVFKMAGTLTVGGAALADSRSIVLAGGAQAKNVFWQVGTFATINPAGGGTMVGTIISQSGVSFSTAGNVAIVTLNGRALSLGASVTMVNTVINVPAP